MTRSLRRDSALGFVAISGFLAGMAVMAVLTLLFGGEPYVPAALSAPGPAPNGDHGVDCRRRGCALRSKRAHAEVDCGA